MNEIIGSEYPIKKIFSKEFNFEIPSYQRPYSWTTEHAGQMFDDFHDFMVTQDQNEAYFLGSIVLIKDKTQTNAEVIDGQQRLITLTILLAAIKSKLNGDDARIFANYVNEPGNRAEGVEPKPRLALRPRDRDFFKKYVQDFNFNKLIGLNPQSITDSQQNIRANAELFQTKLEELFAGDKSEIFDFGKFIVNRCYLVAVSTSSMKSAFRIFLVLNNRGLDLLESDILKADIIGRLPEDRRDHYTQKWEDLEEELDRTNFNDLFGHIRMILLKSKSKTTILDELRKFLLTDRFDPVEFMDNTLIPYAEAYSIILDADFESSQDPVQVNTMLRWLQRIDNSDWIPPAILFLSKHPNDLMALRKFFEELERLAASLFIRGAGVNERIERYAKVIAEIESGKDISSKDSSLDLSEVEIQKTLEVIEGDIYHMSKRSRNYLLLRLNAWLSDGLEWIDYKILTVEHVLPQKVNDGSYWAQQWPDQSTRELWLHKLGNLLLLSRRKNSEAQNYDFLKKKEKYFTGRSGVAAFALTTTVLHQKDWTEQVVKERHDQLVGKLKSGWQLGL